MTTQPSGQFFRVPLIFYGVWAAIVGTLGRVAPLFPATVRTGLATLLVAQCALAAIRPSPMRSRWAYASVFAYGMWSSIRSLMFPLTPGNIVAAATYAMVGFGALITGTLFALLAGLDQVEAAEARTGGQ